MGVPFGDFIAPGLIVMGMLQNAFANPSFSLLVGKIQGTIVDYLQPPLSTSELLAGIPGGAVTRAFCVGGAVWLARSEEHTCELRSLRRNSYAVYCLTKKNSSTRVILLCFNNQVNLKS